MQEIQQQRQCELRPGTGPEPLPVAIRCANERERDPPLSRRDPAASAPGCSDGLFPLFQPPASRGEKRNDVIDSLTKPPRDSLMTCFLYFDLLRVLTLLKLCTYTPVLHRRQL